MQIPKNVVQTGVVDPVHKLYIEDYVQIFLKQHENQAADFYLYGKTEQEEETSYYYIYGASIQEPGWEIKENIYFGDLKKIGEAVSDGTEIWLFMEDGYSAVLDGYFVFYEQNEGMQSYLIAMHQNRPGEYDALNRKRIETPESKTPEKKNVNNIEKKEEKITHKKPVKKKLLAAAVFLTACFLGISARERHPEIGELVWLKRNNDLSENIIAAVEDETIGEPETTGFSVKENTIVQSLEAETEDRSGLPGTEEPETEETADVMSSTPAVITSASYTVKKGDNLAAICRAKYGNTDRIQEVIAMNHLENPNHLYPGQKIIFPDE